MLKKIAKIIWKKSPPFLRQTVVRLTQPKFTVSVAAIVINKENKILLLDHVLRPAASWGFPGGFMNKGENPETALRRELREETGIEISGIKILRARTTNRHVEILFQAESGDNPEVRSLEINSVGWFSIDEMPANMNDSQKSIAEKIIKNRH